MFYGVPSVSSDLFTHPKWFAVFTFMKAHVADGTDWTKVILCINSLFLTHVVKWRKGLWVVEEAAFFGDPD